MNTKLTFKQIIIAGGIAAVVAAVINALLFFIFHALGIISDDVMIQPGQAMTVMPVIFSSILPTLIGACVFFLFEKYSKNGFRNFRILAIVLLILSFGNPFFGIPNVPVTYAIALDTMHVVVAWSLLFFINRAKQ